MDGDSKMYKIITPDHSDNRKEKDRWAFGNGLLPLFCCTPDGTTGRMHYFWNNPLCGATKRLGKGESGVGGCPLELRWGRACGSVSE